MTPADAAPDDSTPDDRAPTARDLVRRRSRSYARDETGRHHHMGGAPERQPLLTDEGATLIGTSAVQLASRTVPQLHGHRDRVLADMARAADELRFEDAARLRDDLVAVEAELARRT